MKVVPVIIGLGALLLASNAGQYFYWSKTSAALETELQEEIATLNASIEAIGPMTSAWTVMGSVEAGTEIKPEQLVELTVPNAIVSDNYIVDPSEIEGKVYKVALTEGIPLTTELVMDKPMDDTLREVDTVVNRWTAGLKVGDYIDYRLTLPYGDDYIVVSHLRVEDVGASSIKVHMNEVDWHMYQSALVDYYLNSDKGAAIYVQKYVEPGVQKPAVTYYAPKENIQAIMTLDPNIVDKAIAKANDSLRPGIDSLLEVFKDTSPNAIEKETAALSAGRGDYNQRVNADVNVKLEEAEQEEFEDESYDYVEDDSAIVDESSEEVLE